MKFIVTGGAGFIGSHLCEKLLSKGKVICFDNFDNYYNPAIKQQNIKMLMNNSNFKLVIGNILDKDTLNKISKNVDYIFHNAAQAGVQASIDNPTKTLEVNIKGTLNVLEAAVNSGVDKVINASSSSVYGKVKFLPFNEEHPNFPISPYGISKLASEHYCRVFNELYGLNTVSLRYFTVFGPNMRPDLAINIFTSKALNNEPIEIFGNGKKTRDFTYIDNIVESNILAMEKGNGIYNIGSGEQITIENIAKNIIEITESKSEIIYNTNKKGDAEHTLANIEKAKNELCYVPKIKLYEGLKKYIDWKISNKILGDKYESI